MNRSHAEKLEYSDQDLQWLQKHNVEEIKMDTPAYPVKFTGVRPQPFLFYAMGNVDLLYQQIL
jgi:predicted Rossmann fold nucleotide-binding protein DprA/Smf involved in DNA uptake